MLWTTSGGRLRVRGARAIRPGFVRFCFLDHLAIRIHIILARVPPGPPNPAGTRKHDQVERGHTPNVGERGEGGGGRGRRMRRAKGGGGGCEPPTCRDCVVAYWRHVGGHISPSSARLAQLGGAMGGPPGAILGCPGRSNASRILPSRPGGGPRGKLGGEIANSSKSTFAQRAGGILLPCVACAVPCLRHASAPRGRGPRRGPRCGRPSSSSSSSSNGGTKDPRAAEAGSPSSPQIPASWSSKHVKKLLAQALLTEMLKKCRVSYESARARGMKF